MSNTIDAHVTENLRRWQASGQPRAWVESHGGHWEHSDWLTLLANLRHSEFWPLEAAEVGALLEKLRRERFNLHRLDQSGLLGRWVEARRGQWNDTDCLALLEYLRDTGFWPIQSEVVRRVLEGATREWHNLRRWEQSGQGRRWAEAHGGEWHHGDWLSLVGMLQQSEFWPLDLVAVGAVLEGLKQAASNLRCWIGSGWPRRWVDDQRGRWEHDHWLVLLEALRRSPYWPLDEDSVGRTVEEFRRKRQNLQRWERSGQARQWVSARQGRWEHEDWLALLDGLSHSEFWPVDAEAVGEVLADIQTEWRNLRCWQESVEVRKWLGDRQGRWGRDEWLSLQASLRESRFWPMDRDAAEGVLRQLTAEWWNLRQWRASGQPWLWVDARGGRWGHEEWLALLEALRPSQYWPLDPVAVGQVLEEVKAEWLRSLAQPGLLSAACERVEDWYSPERRAA